MIILESLSKMEFSKPSSYTSIIAALAVRSSTISIEEGFKNFSARDAITTPLKLISNNHSNSCLTRIFKYQTVKVCLIHSRRKWFPFDVFLLNKFDWLWLSILYVARY